MITAVGYRCRSQFDMREYVSCPFSFPVSFFRVARWRGVTVVAVLLDCSLANDTAPVESLSVNWLRSSRAATPSCIYRLSC